MSFSSQTGNIRSLGTMGLRWGVWAFFLITMMSGWTGLAWAQSNNCPNPTPEICDGKDNDCDGLIDETCQCVGTQSRTCGFTDGDCTQGTQTCVLGAWSSVCVGSTPPIAEICDNKDNDCDGTIDDGLLRPCFNACGTGQETCKAGKWEGCTAPQPATEVCDNKDNDCDGAVDEALTRACNTSCGTGTEACALGQWTNCTAKPPTPEICDNVDNDCDGQIDEGLTRTCATACGTGTETCAKGSFSGCTAPQPATEICDNKDNDCDGAIDEAVTRPCRNNCGTGIETCVQGNFTGCTAPPPAIEICDTLDNDCDGQIDEGCACTTGQTRACGVDTGECQKGTQACVNGNWLSQCVGEVTGTPELCDNKDNDCDGTVDESLTRPCANACGSGTETCSSGSWINCSAPQSQPETCDNTDNDCDGTVDEGLTRPCANGCGKGTETCSFGSWVACTAPAPTTEICDNKDNDCDGQIDENLTRACANACGVGQETCNQGTWVNCTAPPTSPETCDNKDNDCDGQVDEGLTRPCANICGPGTESCLRGQWQGCNAPLPQPETCDGKDNDCDGKVDENCQCQNGATRPCGKDTGECKSGTQTCVNGTWSRVCQGETPPVSETCDNKDNDCDGFLDEGLVRPCTNNCGTGQETCKAGKWVDCSAPQPQSEVCDNKDNDCDGQIDENVTRTCNNACGSGVEQCAVGTWQNCSAPQPQPEICDGKDNDCDGTTDEGCQCKTGDTQPCGTNTGECKQGTQTCVAGTWAPCAGNTGPTQETCDGKDNDCDGSIDENLTQACKNNCGSGTEICVQGKWAGCTAPKPVPESCDNQDNDCDGTTDESLTRPCTNSCGTGQETCNKGKWENCSAPQPQTEVCDGKDNDCDGDIDESCACTTGARRECGTDTGTCTTGTQICVAGKWPTVCAGATPPASETCDNKDNDCDGTIDENLSRSCTNSCGSGQEQCTAGRWVNCTAPTISTEVCDGKDNDCDGTIDESLTQPCTNSCGTGQETCNKGKWENCSAPQPQPEVCDGKDNDCDGTIDETCTCTTGQTRACGSDIGACQKGLQVCVLGKWSACTGAVNGTAELCDNTDNDCDGKVDEEVTQPCVNSCGSGVETCDKGKFTNCNAPTPEAESCDGKDNNCDGFVDENLQRSCYTGPSGSSGKGECQDGVQICQQGQWGICAGQGIPTPEVCDGKDNDCDGSVDKSLERNCYSGPSNTDGQGPCKGGKQTCSSGQWGTCNGEVLPQPETCDGKDNDCDGAIDENQTKDCSTACGNGQETCKAGKFESCSAPQPQAETCDGKDNNCDGLIDETCDCKDGQSRSCGTDIGECKSGTQRCVSGKWEASCSGQTTATVETCDGKDNDCDGLVDERLIQTCYTGPAGSKDKGTCTSGTQACVAGQWSTCVGEQKPAPEVCDNQDNDCNGTIDDNLERACYTGASGTLNRGQCKAGKQTCSSGLWGTCSGEVIPAKEICDNKDNDCDGQLDEGCPCTPGESRRCGTDTGECISGLQRCINKIWSNVCAGETRSVPEICDAKDNDCDGQIDEFVVRDCYSGPKDTAGKGACKQGIQSCSSGQWGRCLGEVVPSKEVCDGEDNNCNGMIDESLKRICYSGGLSTRGKGECKDGEQTCTDGQWGACNNEVLPVQETCDGKDNDCDSRVDNRAGTTTPLQQPCVNSCGVGQQICEASAWKTCSAPCDETPTTEPAADAGEQGPEEATTEPGPEFPDNLAFGGGCGCQSPPTLPTWLSFLLVILFLLSLRRNRAET